MKSAFDREAQQEAVDSKLVVAFEKMAEALRVLLWDQAKVHGLSPIQIQILIFLKNHEADMAKPALLATEFNVTRPTISDALKALQNKGLVEAKPNPEDSRSRLLSLTKQALQLGDKLETFANPLQSELASLKTKDKSTMLERMMALIESMSQSGIISAQRMCYNCIHYEGNRQQKHYCHFLQKDLSNADLRIDCPEHAVS